jgi:N-formylglutamate deformylase
MTASPPPFLLRRGSSPLVVSVPHAGVFVPPELAADLSDAARAVPDTDWHVDALVAFVLELDATLLVATHSRFVVDLNRPPDDAPLYPGQAGTGLVPETLFDGTPAWTRPQDPAPRVDAVWRPYHAALEHALEVARVRHGHAVLWDAHSIRGRVPRLFEGTLPDLNLGTNSGASCAPGLRAAAAGALEASPFSHVVDGRFRGGFITRHYGRPDAGVHAVQLEMAQHCYLDESAPPPPPLDRVRTAALDRTLRAFAEALLAWRP